MKSAGDLLPSRVSSLLPSATPQQASNVGLALADTLHQLGARARPRTASVREHDRGPPRRKSTTASAREHDRLGARARPPRGESTTASAREHGRLGARARPPRRKSTTTSAREHTAASAREHDRLGARARPVDRLGATERSAIQSYKSVVCVFVYFLLIEFINVYKRLLSLFTSSAAPTESVHKQRVMNGLFTNYRFTI